MSNQPIASAGCQATDNSCCGGSVPVRAVYHSYLVNDQSPASRRGDGGASITELLRFPAKGEASQCRPERRGHVAATNDSVLLAPSVGGTRN
jgi:hypothetical protein